MTRRESRPQCCNFKCNTLLPPTDILSTWLGCRVARRSIVLFGVILTNGRQTPSNLIWSGAAQDQFTHIVFTGLRSDELYDMGKLISFLVPL